MADSSNTQSSGSGGGSGLIALLTAIQQGVTTVNATTQAIKLIFPSSS